MPWKITMKMLDENDNVLLEEEVINDKDIEFRHSRMVLATKMLARNRSIDWTKFSVFVEQTNVH